MPPTPLTLDPPHTPPKYPYSLPPSYITHLRLLIRQWLQDQLAPPDEGLPGPSNRVADRPLWSDQRLAQVEAAVISCFLGRTTEVEEGLLKCDWAGWAKGAVRRKKAYKRGREKRKEGEGEERVQVDNGTTRGMGFRLPVNLPLPSGLGSVISTPTRTPSRPASIASSTRSRDASSAGGPIEAAHAGGAHEKPEERAEAVADDTMEEWCEIIKRLKGFVAFDPCATQRESWEVINDDLPARTPIRDFPGAFPQASSSSYFPTPPSAPSPSRPPPPLPDPLPELLKPFICLSFIPSSSPNQGGSTRSQSTVRLTRQPSGEGSQVTRGVTREGQGSGGLAGLGGWFGNKWSEMTIPAEEGKVEIEFIKGKWALPVNPNRPRRRSSTRHHTVTDDADQSEDEEADTGSAWSGTEIGHGRGDNGGRQAVNVVICGQEGDVPLEAVNRGDVGVIGGTIIVRGMKRKEERKGLEKVFKGIIYAIQSQTLELSLLQAFSIPPEPLPPPPPPPKPILIRKRTIDPPQHVPSLGRTNSQSKRGFLAKLGLDKGRESWGGFLGRRRGSSGGTTTRIGGSRVDDQDGVDDMVPEYPVSPTSTSSAVPPLPEVSTPIRQTNQNLTGIQRHLQLLANLREMQHSTTPGLRFALPPILKRVEEEDRVRRIKAGEEVGHITPSPAGGLGRSQASSNTASFGDSVMTAATSTSSSGRNPKGYDGLPLPPLATTSNTLGLPFSLPTLGISGDEIKGRALGYRLGGDIRSGLQSLGGTLEGWDGFWRLQRLEYLFWTGVEEDMVEDKIKEKRNGAEGEADVKEEQRVMATEKKGMKEIIACTKPVASTHRFYNPSSDLSIEDYLSGLAEELGYSSPSRSEGELLPTKTPDEQISNHTARVVPHDGTPTTRRESDESHTSDDSWENVCPRSGCTVAEKDHVRIWAAAGRKVIAKITKSEAVEFEKQGQETEKVKGVGVWMECAMCGQRTERRSLGEGVSWNKFLELILFSAVLIPPICSHTSSPPPSPPPEVIYHIVHPLFSLALRPSAQKVFEARLPKLQVGPNVAKRRTGVEAAKAAAEAFGRKVPNEGNVMPDITYEQTVFAVEKWAGEMREYLEELMYAVPPEPPAKGPDLLPCPNAAPNTARSSLLAIRDRLTQLYQAHPPTDHAGNDIPAILTAIDRREYERIVEDVIAWKKEYCVDTAAPMPVLPAQRVKRDDGLKLPGSNVLIRDDEPASVIAYTLSSLAYFNELCGGPKPLSSEPVDSNTVPPEDKWTIEVCRRDTPRDILPLRTLAKKRSEISLPSARLPLAVTPLQPSLELNLQPVVGHLGHESGTGMEDLVKSISKATSVGLVNATTPVGLPSRPASTEPTMTAPSSESEDDRLSKEKARTSTPRIRRKVTGEAPPSSYRRSVSASVSLTGSPLLTPASGQTPPRPTVQTSHQRTVSGIPSPSPVTSAVSTPRLKDGTITPSDKDKEGWGSVTSSFTSSFNTIMKLSSGMTDSLTSRVRTSTTGDSRSLASFMAPLLSSDTVPADDRPHIHLSLSHRDYKISCTVYYAQAFDTLRRRCAFDKSFVRSLERTTGWSAEGGKSKASFWKTQDGRLVVKSLVSKWNVSDLQALLEIAPAYFEHMATTHNKATALAKIVGFYSVRIHDVKTNEKRTMDLLVMENLFWKQDIDRTFDLKGIEGRKLPKGRDNETTKFDGEWLDQQTTKPLFIHSHAKRILLDSLTTDTRFLSSQSIMDYSLLLGLDRRRSELVVGLVDAVGSYGLFKNIESMGKMALNRGREGEVTIIPPDQYRERFEHALKAYFTACPDKWSRSVQRIGAISVDQPSIF